MKDKLMEIKEVLSAYEHCEGPEEFYYVCKEVKRLFDILDEESAQVLLEGLESCREQILNEAK